MRLPYAPGLALFAALLLPTAGSAADGGKLSDAQRQYQEDRALCMSGKSGQDRATCLREAGAALQAARRGQLEDSQAAYEKNSLLRCTYLPAADRTDCERRMRGEGTTSGSVAGGGIYREIRTVVPAPEAQ